MFIDSISSIIFLNVAKFIMPCFLCILSLGQKTQLALHKLVTSTSTVDGPLDISGKLCLQTPIYKELPSLVLWRLLTFLNIMFLI